MTTETTTITFKSLHLNPPTRYRSIPISLHLNKRTPQPTTLSLSLRSPPVPVKEDDFGLCEECNRPNSSKGYCSSCSSSHFQKNFDRWTSGNDDIDKLIKSTQTSSRRAFVEWIPYDDLHDVKYISKSSFSTTYSATWTSGPIMNWNQSSEDWNLSLLNCSYQQHKEIMPIYGLTQDPITKDYMVVMKFERGNLRNFINDNFTSLSWSQKLKLLHSIATGLHKIHSSGLSHNNLHSGNIFVKKEDNGDLSAIISDLGMSGPADKSYDLCNSRIDTFGVIQYTPSEIFHGRIYTKYSDIYFFAMLMYEVSTGLPPFINVPFDKLNELIFDICDGFRPAYNSKDMPRCFEELMKKCWDDDEFSRPLASQLVDIIGNWISEDISRRGNLIRLKYPLSIYDIYKSQRINTTDLGDEDFEHDSESNFENVESDEDIELNTDFERKGE
ncbi:12985_t:CDS:2 [Funneliformis caledonium]|uniref:12985_t:CDS:1 n=1 Tax=Funneliformis caledonium TaxID=1117310 RepID=A0A9N9GRL9_9GLOM|nr:12985_t:CDS:2 [Funneliformis caledonium]